MVWPTVQNAGQRDQLALHQAAGAVLGVRQAFRDAGAFLARDRVEDLLALRVVEVLEHGDGVVALHVRDRLGGPFRTDLPDQLLTDVVLDMGEHVAAQYVVGDRDEAAALAGTEALDQIGDVGLVQGRDQGAHPVAVVLPGAYYTLGGGPAPPVEALRAQGVAMAVASDCNPGSSPALSLLLMLNMACTLFRLTPEEALAGVTRNAAAALGLAADRGTLSVGKRADLALWDIGHPAELAYWIGANPCLGAVRDGAPANA